MASDLMLLPLSCTTTTESISGSQATITSTLACSVTSMGSHSWCWRTKSVKNLCQALWPLQRMYLECLLCAEPLRMEAWALTIDWACSCQIYGSNTSRRRLMSIGRWATWHTVWQTRDGRKSVSAMLSLMTKQSWETRPFPCGFSIKTSTMAWISMAKTHSE